MSVPAIPSGAMQSTWLSTIPPKHEHACSVSKESAANLRGVSFDEAEAMDSHACPAECWAHFRKDGRNHNGLKISERQPPRYDASSTCMVTVKSALLRMISTAKSLEGERQTTESAVRWVASMPRRQTRTRGSHAHLMPRGRTSRWQA